MYFRDDNDKVLKVKIRHLQAVKIVHFFIKIQIQKLCLFFYCQNSTLQLSKRLWIFLLYITISFWTFHGHMGFFSITSRLPNTLQIKFHFNVMFIVGTNMRKIYQQFKPLKKPCVHETSTYIIGIIIFFHDIKKCDRNIFFSFTSAYFYCSI